MNDTMYLTRLGYPPIVTRPGETTYPVYCVATNDEIGRIVTHQGQSPTTVYISWYLDEEHRGRGYMFDAVAQILPILLERYHRIVAMIWTTNNRSKQLAKRAGFHYEGTAKHLHQKTDGSWQDVEFWALVEGLHVSR
jgi:RimJ/RimL family protein N-acetyltransferase